MKRDEPVFWLPEELKETLPPSTVKDLFTYFNEREIPEVHTLAWGILNNDLEKALQGAQSAYGFFPPDNYDPNKILEVAFNAVRLFAPKMAYGDCIKNSRWHSGNGLTMERSMLFDPISTDELDDLIYAGYPLDMLEGRRVKWYGEETKVEIRHGSPKLHVTVVCHKCHTNKDKVWVRSGLHSGAWCYVENDAGEYAACLRDQVYSCDSPDCKELAERHKNQPIMDDSEEINQ